jgi:hypothetical protein
MEIWSSSTRSYSISRHSRFSDRSPICTRTSVQGILQHCVAQVSIARLNVTENVTIYIDWVQRFNYSKPNGSISFISPEAAVNNSYAQILVLDALGVESATPDRLYYSDKVCASKARVCRLAHHERCHDLAAMRFASDSCCRFAVRRLWGLWGRPGLRAVPRGLRPSLRRLLRCSAVFAMAPLPAGCDLSRRLPLLA